MECGTYFSNMKVMLKVALSVLSLPVKYRMWFSLTFKKNNSTHTHTSACLTAVAAAGDYADDGLGSCSILRNYLDDRVYSCHTMTSSLLILHLTKLACHMGLVAAPCDKSGALKVLSAHSHLAFIGT